MKKKNSIIQTSIKHGITLLVGSIFIPFSVHGADNIQDHFHKINESLTNLSNTLSTETNEQDANACLTSLKEIKQLTVKIMDKISLEKIKELFIFGLNNYRAALQEGKSYEEMIDLLTPGANALRTCKSVHENMGIENTQAKTTDFLLFGSLYYLSSAHYFTGMNKTAPLFNDFKTKKDHVLLSSELALLIKQYELSIESMNYCYKLKPHLIKSYENIIDITELNINTIYSDLFGVIQAIFLFHHSAYDEIEKIDTKETVANLFKVNKLNNISENMILITSFISSYLTNSDLISNNARIILDKKEHVKSRKKIIINDKNETKKMKKIYQIPFLLEMVAQPERLLPLCWITYCKAMRSSSYTFNILANQCITPLSKISPTSKQLIELWFLREMFPYGDIFERFISFYSQSHNNIKMAKIYLTKSSKCLSQGIETYKKQLYKGEYVLMPDKEEVFVSARLDDLIGNPLPLSDFYRTLQRERKDKNEQKIWSLIRDHQEDHQKREEERASKRIVKSTAAVSRASNCQGPSHVDSASDDTLDLYNSNHLFIKPQENITSKPKTKIKTRNPGASQPLQSMIVEKNEAKKEEKISDKITLQKGDYKVFQILTGGSLDRNINLENVKKLLVNLGCTIPQGTGGSHRKASAPQGGAWTIPPAWDGPIPDFYRQQLNDFLQNTMGIDPEDIFGK